MAAASVEAREVIQLLRTLHGEDGEPRFSAAAQLLLNRAVILAGGRIHRPVEVECYYYSASHPDPFAHRHPVQRTSSRWYFHRDHDSYRGGSFKGVDVTCGPEDSFGGILVRTVEAPDGRLINGCSLWVDRLLSLTGHETVARLDGEIGERSVWDRSSPLHLRLDEELLARDVLATARVGLTLKRMDREPTMPRYLMRPYRFLTELSISKGKVHTVVALHEQGWEPDRIRRATGSTVASVREYLSAYREGEGLPDLGQFSGRPLGTKDLCRLHGAWHRRYGRGDRASGGEAAPLGGGGKPRASC